jgi:hypothetical protein
MKNPFAKVSWFSPNLSLKLLSVGAFLSIGIAILFPRLIHFILGLAFSWSGILVLQIFGLKPLEEIDRDKNLITQLNLHS